MATIRGHKIAEKRLKERQIIFGDCEKEVWSLDAKGFTSIPRVLPLILRLLSHGAEKSKGNPDRVYLELWTRSFEGGFIKIDDEDGAAFSAGYQGSRATRTWKEHMGNLRDMGFIQAKANGNKEFGYVLIINPLLVAARYIKNRKADENWVNAFVARCNEVGTLFPEELDFALKRRNDSSKKDA